MSTFMAKILCTVSRRVSPFLTELPEEEKLTTSGERRFSASSKESLVRVEFSKKILAMVTSRREGTFLMGRLSTSLKLSAVSKMSSKSPASKSLIPNKCLLLSGIKYSVLVYCVMSQIWSLLWPCSCHSTSTFCDSMVLTSLPT